MRDGLILTLTLTLTRTRTRTLTRTRTRILTLTLTLTLSLTQAKSTLQSRDDEVSALQARLAAADERAAALSRQNNQQAELLRARLVGRSPPPTPPLPDWDEVLP